jgi:hypothetical protein
MRRLAAILIALPLVAVLVLVVMPAVRGGGQPAPSDAVTVIPRRPAVGARKRRPRPQRRRCRPAAVVLGAAVLGGRRAEPRRRSRLAR